MKIIYSLLLLLLEDNIKRDLQKVGGIVGTGWSGLRIGTGGGHL
jgi:hypothetical protein